MADFGDPTQWLRLLADREDRELRRQALAQQQMQQQLDNAFRAEGRAMDIAESIERRALMVKQQSVADFNLHMAQQAFKEQQEDRPLEVRFTKAKAEGAEFDLERAKQQLEFEAEDRPLQNRLNRARIEGAELDVQIGKAKLAEMEMDSQFLGGFLPPLQQGMAAALGDSPNLETLARTAWGSDKVASFAEKHLPAKMRAKLNKEGFRKLLFAPIGAHLEGRAKQGDIETAGAILGASPFSEVLSPFVSDEARTAARQAITRGLNGLGSLIESYPTGKDLQESVYLSGDTNSALQLIDERRDSAREAMRQLGRKEFLLDDFVGMTSKYVSQGVEKIREYDKVAEDLQAFTVVENTGASIVTESQRRGFDMKVSGMVERVMTSTDPANDITKLADIMKAAATYPRAQIQQVWTAAARSGDPLAELRASQMFDILKKKLDGKFERAQMYEDIRAKPGLLERLDLLSQLRSSRSVEEFTAIAPVDGEAPGQARDRLQAYAIGIVSMANAVSENKTKIADDMRARQEGKDVSSKDKINDVLPGDTSPEADAIRRQNGLRTVEHFLGGGDSMWSLGGTREVLDSLDYEASWISEEFMTDFYNEMANYPEDESPSVETRVEAAKAAISSTYSKPFMGEKVTKFHPVKLARANKMNFDDDLAGDLTKWQLQTEFLNDIIASDERFARITVDDVYLVPVQTPDERIPFAYHVRLKRDGTTLVHPSGKSEWFPGFSLPELQRIHRELDPRNRPSIHKAQLRQEASRELWESIFGGPEVESDRLWKSLDKALGEHSPTMIERRAKSAASQSARLDVHPLSTRQR